VLRSLDLPAAYNTAPSFYQRRRDNSKDHVSKEKPVQDVFLVRRSCSNRHYRSDVPLSRSYVLYIYLLSILLVLVCTIP